MVLGVYPMKPKPLKLEDIEIVRLSGGHSGGRKKPLAKNSRAQELRYEIVTLRHVPSGREESFEIPAGHYSKREMQRLREELKEQFLINLSGNSGGP